MADELAIANYPGVWPHGYLVDNPCHGLNTGAPAEGEEIIPYDKRVDGPKRWKSLGYKESRDTFYSFRELDADNRLRRALDEPCNVRLLFLSLLDYNSAISNTVEANVFHTKAAKRGKTGWLPPIDQYAREFDPERVMHRREGRVSFANEAYFASLSQLAYETDPEIYKQIPEDVAQVNLFARGNIEGFVVNHKNAMITTFRGTQIPEGVTDVGALSDAGTDLNFFRKSAALLEASFPGQLHGGFINAALKMRDEFHHQLRQRVQAPLIRAVVEIYTAQELSLPRASGKSNFDDAIKALANPQLVLTRADKEKLANALALQTNFFNGHSLGAALAVIMGSYARNWYDHHGPSGLLDGSGLDETIAQRVSAIFDELPSYANVEVNIRGFGPPLVGTDEFAANFAALGLDEKTLQWANQNDFVSQIPPHDLLGYVRVGILGFIGPRLKPYVHPSPMLMQRMANEAEADLDGGPNNVEKITNHAPFGYVIKFALLATMERRGMFHVFVNKHGGAVTRIQEALSMTDSDLVITQKNFDAAHAILQTIPETDRDLRFYKALGADVRLRLYRHGIVPGALSFDAQIASEIENYFPVMRRTFAVESALLPDDLRGRRYATETPAFAKISAPGRRKDPPREIRDPEWVQKIGTVGDLLSSGLAVTTNTKSTLGRIKRALRSPWPRTSFKVVEDAARTQLQSVASKVWSDFVQLTPDEQGEIQQQARWRLLDLVKPEQIWDALQENPHNPYLAAYFFYQQWWSREKVGDSFGVLGDLDWHEKHVADTEIAQLDPRMHVDFHEYRNPFGSACERQNGDSIGPEPR